VVQLLNQKSFADAGIASHEQRSDRAFTRAVKGGQQFFNLTLSGVEFLRIL